MFNKQCSGLWESLWNHEKSMGLTKGRRSGITRDYFVIFGQNISLAELPSFISSAPQFTLLCNRNNNFYLFLNWGIVIINKTRSVC